MVVCDYSSAPVTVSAQAEVMLVDLHTHTNASDGELTPHELLALQAEAGVGLVAITDHDTLCGWDRVQGQSVAATRIPRLLPGIEFSVEVGRREVHVLGLGFDPDHPVLRQAVCRQQLRRRERAERIADRLEYLGVSGALAGAEAAAGGAGIGRPHFAHFLVASGRVRSVDEAFRRYLGRGKPAACRVEWPPLHEVLGWIRAAGGSTVLAHPHAYRLSRSGLRALVAEFCAAGGDALEVAMPGLAAGELEVLARLTREARLRASAGSDFHRRAGWNHPARIPPLPPGLDALWEQWGHC